MFEILCDVLATVAFIAAFGAACAIGWQVIRHIRAWRIGRRMARNQKSRITVYPAPRRKYIVSGDREVKAE